MKHVDHLTEINKLRKVPSCWLYSENTQKLVKKYFIYCCFCCWG